MSGFWSVWCPVCRELRPTRIPDVAGAESAVAREYDAHMQQKHGQERE